MRYLVLIDGTPGAYGVTVPDMPGCTSAGATTDTALRGAVQAIQLWAEDALAEGDVLPRRRTAEQMRHDPQLAKAIRAGALLAMAPLLLDAGRSARATI